MSATLMSALGVALALLSVSASADVLYVDPDAPGSPDGTSWDTAWHTIEDALNAASFGDEIRIGEGTYHEYGLGLLDDLLLAGGYAGYGAPDPNAWDPSAYVTTIDGAIQGSIIVADNALGVTIRGITFTNGYSQFGGALNLTGCGVTVEQCTFDGNQAVPPEVQDPARGGAMFVQAGELHLQDSVFHANGAGADGGALYLNECLDVALSGCLFQENTSNTAGESDGLGSAIHAHGCPLAIDDCQFVGNYGSPDYSWGTVRVDDVTLELTGSAFTGNTALSQGGALAATESELLIDGCTFQQNAAGWAGGAMSIRDSTGTVTRCEIEGNTAPVGGGVFAYATTIGRTGDRSAVLVIDGNAFIGNAAEGYLPGYDRLGGGIATGFNPVPIVNSFFAANDADYGGGIAVLGPMWPAFITNNTLVANHAHIDGGGICAVPFSGRRRYAPQEQAPTYVTNCILLANAVGLQTLGGSGGYRPLNGGEGGAVYAELETHVSYSCMYDNVPGDLSGTVQEGDGNVYADPLLAAEDDPHLLPLSPCYNAGSNDAPDLDLVTTDFEGDDRIVAGTVDIGCDEYTGPPGRDVAVTGMALTPAPLHPFAQATVSVTVENMGALDEPAARVKILVDGAQVGTTQVVALAIGESATVDFPWTPQTLGVHVVEGRVEPTAGQDSWRANNSRRLSAHVVGADIAVTKLDCFPRNPIPGYPATLYVHVKNQGTHLDPNVRVKALIDGVQVAETSYTALRPGQSARAVFHWTPTAEGKVVFEGRAEPSAPPDYDRRNNSARENLHAIAPDVEVHGLFTIPQTPRAGEEAWLGAFVYNNSAYPEPAARVKLYAGGQLIGTRTVSMGPHQWSAVAIPYTFGAAGRFLVEGRIEPTAPPDIDRADNYRRGYVTVVP